jgi:tetratricopeptide (TPR) repeat protein
MVTVVGVFSVRQPVAGADVATPPVAPVPSQPADDEIAPLAPRRARTEPEEDRLHAASLFAAGRMADRAGSHEAAMKYYVRAFRYDPRNIEAIKRAQMLALLQGRQMLAARYASQLALARAVDPLDLLRGVVYLRQEGRTAQALAAYEKSLGDHGGAAASPAWVELHKQAGEMYLQVKKYAQAADAFARVGEAIRRPEVHGLDQETLKLIQGDAPALYSQMAEAYFKAERFAPASEVIERGAKEADEAWTVFQRARLAAAQKQHDEALKLLDTYLDKKLSSQDAGPYHLLADILASKGQSPQLRLKLERALASDGDNQPLGFFLAGQYLADGQLPEARALYSKLLARKPSTAGFRGLVGAAHRAGDVAALLTALGEAVGTTGGLGVLGDAADAVSKDKQLVGKLAAEADRRFKEKPAELKSGERLAVALLAASARQFDVAERFFERAIQMDQESADKELKGALLSAWGLALISGEQYAPAVDVLQRAIDERAVPADNPTLNYYLAGALSMVKRHDAALVAARKAAAEKAPAELASRVGWVHYRAMQYQAAQTAYREFLQRFDGVHDAPGVREAVRDARQTLSHICTLLGEAKQSVELLEEVLDEFPDDIGVRNDLGYLWADQGRHLLRSLAMIQEAVAAEPDNAAYRDSLGWVFFRLGRYEEAVAELTRASAGDKPDGVVLDHLGDALEKAGRQEDALATWKRAVAAFDEDDAAKKKLTAEKIRRVEMERRDSAGK